MKYAINPEFKKDFQTLSEFVIHFDEGGVPFGNQDRNSLKLFELNGMTLNIKSFRIPNFINQLAYRFIRKSKAQRSFEYANRLQGLRIGTPKPIAYFEFSSLLLFKKSYYVSEQSDCDLTYRELTTDFNYPDHEEILRAFTRFTFKLHEKGVHFLDHSPGNTLIKKKNGGYEFFLVDLNRMEFKTLDFQKRVKNFSKLTTHKFMVEIMSDEYAKCSGEDYQPIFDLMWSETEAFQNRYHKKRRMKKKLLFWRSGS